MIHVKNKKKTKKKSVVNSDDTLDSYKQSVFFVYAISFVLDSHKESVYYIAHV